MKVVILCGGEGSRLFPISRESFPKQFIKLDGKSFLEKTFERALLLVDKKDIFISTNKKYFFLVKDTLGEDANVIDEPEVKNTAGAVLFALKKINEDDVVVFLPSDHEIEPKEKFVDDIKKALKIAEEEYIVLFGIRPTRPETGYGYIKKGDKLNSCFLAESFIEKPEREKAERFVESGKFFWNSGIYMAKASTFLSELKNVSPELKDFVDLSFEELEKNYSKLPSISIDKALSERSRKLVVFPANFSWSDVGSWDSIYELLPKDESRNAVAGEVLSVNSRNSLFLSKERLMVAIDLEDIIAVDTKDVILLAKKGSTQKVRDVVRKLKETGKKEALEHRVVFRPWGSYEVLLEGERFKVKRVRVKPGKRLSLQLHHHRAEHWIVVRGTARVIIGDREVFLHENESAYVPKSTLHRIENVGRIPLEIIEVQTGEYVEEDDIIRVEDDWERE